MILSGFKKDELPTGEMLRIIAPFRKAGFALHWLAPRSKKPIGKAWPERAVATFEELRETYEPGNNIGVRLGEPSRLDACCYLHALDIDIRKPELAGEAWAALAALFPSVDLDGLPSAISGSGGESRHRFFTTDRPFKGKKLAQSETFEMVFDPKLGRKVKKADWEIELFGTGKQVVLPPSIHPDTGLPYRWEREFDLARIALDPDHITPEALVAAGANDESEETPEGAADRIGLTLDKTRKILAWLPLNEWCEDYNGWIKVGMALKHEFGDDAFKLWCNFGKQSAKYKERDHRYQWGQFKGKAKRPFRMATLMAAAHEAEMDERNAELLSDSDDDDFAALRDAPPTANDDDLECFDGPDSDPIIDRLNKIHAVISHNGRTLITTEYLGTAVAFGTVADLNTFYANDRRAKPDSKTGATEPVSAYWLRHSDRRTYRQLIFEPGAMRPGALNLWRGWAVEPDPAKSCDHFLDHVRTVVCRGNPDHAEYVFGWLAHLVQRPAEKPGVALVLRGGKGAGKDSVAEYVAAMIGRQYVPTVSHQKHIVGNFNRRLETALLLHVQEGIWAGDKQAESNLKFLVTSEFVEIERKGIDSFTLPSFLRIFISSNADWTVPASEDERRWAVFDVSSARRGDSAYFRDLRREMASGGPAALLAWLQAYDLSDFDVRTAPDTLGLLDQKMASLRNVEAWWHDVLAAGELPDPLGDDSDWADGPRRVSCDYLRRCYADWMKQRRFDGETANDKQFGLRLRRMCEDIETIRPAGKPRPPRQYVFPALQDCRQAFSEWIGGEVDWT